MTTYPKAHKIIKPPSLLPIRTDSTDIRKTFAAARRATKANETCKVVTLPPLSVEDPVVSGTVRPFRYVRRGE